jgi:hypothetical protein
LYHFAPYRCLRQGTTDSAAPATAFSTGRKTYNADVNWRSGAPLRSMAEIAKANGRATGIVSSVECVHATPAALGGAPPPHYPLTARPPGQRILCVKGTPFQGVRQCAPQV